MSSRSKACPSIYYAKAAPKLDPVARIDHAETSSPAPARRSTTAATGLLRRRNRLRADAAVRSFRDAESYYATLAHELTHWTKHPQRLDRDFGRKRLGDEGYARRNSSPSWAPRSSAPISNCAGAARRSRRLHRDLAGGPEERQPRDLRRRRPRATRRRLPQPQGRRAGPETCAA